MSVVVVLPQPEKVVVIPVTGLPVTSVNERRGDVTGLAEAADLIEEINRATTAEELLAGGAPGSDAWLISNIEAIAWTDIERDPLTQVILSAEGVWPDGRPATHETDVVNALRPRAIDSYHVTYSPASGPVRTVTQPTVTRNVNGNVIAQPAFEVS